MANLVNIPRDVIDPFYRYRRPMVKLGVLNSKGGVAVLVNIALIAKSLNRKIDEIKSFLQKNLKCAIQIKNDELHIRCQVTVQILEDLLEIYIHKFVLCRTCGNPETHNNHCNACGN